MDPRFKKVQGCTWKDIKWEIKIEKYINFSHHP